MKMNLFKFNYKKCYKTTFYGAFTKKFIITFAKKGGLKCVNQNESFYIQLFKICCNTEPLNLSIICFWSFGLWTRATVLLNKKILSRLNHDVAITIVTSYAKLHLILKFTYMQASAERPFWYKVTPFCGGLLTCI